ncbi:hypothetical protein GWI33_022714, partial [Rhynchophorus ferrugineus]
MDTPRENINKSKALWDVMNTKFLGEKVTSKNENGQKRDGFPRGDIATFQQQSELRGGLRSGDRNTGGRMTRPERGENWRRIDRHTDTRRTTEEDYHGIRLSNGRIVELR